MKITNRELGEFLKALGTAMLSTAADSTETAQESAPAQTPAVCSGTFEGSTEPQEPAPPITDEAQARIKELETELTKIKGQSPLGLQPIKL